MVPEDAKCSNRRDEIRIREAIAGFEQEVEIAIEILMKAGAYDDSSSSSKKCPVFCCLTFLCLYMGVSKNSGTPKSSILIGVFHHKPSILGYPYFWKHPYFELINNHTKTTSNSLIQLMSIPGRKVLTYTSFCLGFPWKLCGK